MCENPKVWVWVGQNPLLLEAFPLSVLLKEIIKGVNLMKN